MYLEISFFRKNKPFVVISVSFYDGKGVPSYDGQGGPLGTMTACPSSWSLQVLRHLNNARNRVKVFYRETKRYSVPAVSGQGLLYERCQKLLIHS